MDIKCTVTLTFEESDCAAEKWRAVSAPRDAGAALTRTTNGSLRQSDLWSLDGGSKHPLDNEKLHGRIE